MVAAEGAISIDSTSMSAQQVFEQVIEVVENKLKN
jgi:cytidylate kinase